MLSNNIWGGVKIIQSEAMVEPGEPIEVPRTWRERLFTLPWRPFKKTKTVIPMVPQKRAIKLPGGELIMHPTMVRALMEAIHNNE